MRVMPTSAPSTLATLAIAALAACGYVGGWLILLLGGFRHAPNRYAAGTTFVDGAPAMFLALTFFSLAAAGAASWLRARQAGLRRRLIGCGAVLLPPLLFVLLGRTPFM